MSANCWIGIGCFNTTKEIVLTVLEYCTIQTILNLRLVCKWFESLVRQSSRIRVHLEILVSRVFCAYASVVLLERRTRKRIIQQFNCYTFDYRRDGGGFWMNNIHEIMCDKHIEDKKFRNERQRHRYALRHVNCPRKVLDLICELIVLYHPQRIRLGCYIKLDWPETQRLLRLVRETELNLNYIADLRLTTDMPLVEGMRRRCVGRGIRHITFRAIANGDDITHNIEVLADCETEYLEFDMVGNFKLWDIFRFASRSKKLKRLRLKCNLIQLPRPHSNRKFYIDVPTSPALRHLEMYNCTFDVPPRSYKCGRISVASLDCRYCSVMDYFNFPDTTHLALLGSPHWPLTDESKNMVEQFKSLECDYEAVSLDHEIRHLLNSRAMIRCHIKQLTVFSTLNTSRRDLKWSLDKLSRIKIPRVLETFTLMIKRHPKANSLKEHNPDTEAVERFLDRILKSHHVLQSFRLVPVSAGGACDFIKHYNKMFVYDKSIDASLRPHNRRQLVAVA